VDRNRKITSPITNLLLKTCVRGFEIDRCKNNPFTISGAFSHILDLLSLSRSPYKLKKNKSQSEPVDVLKENKRITLSRVERSVCVRVYYDKAKTHPLLCFVAHKIDAHTYILISARKLYNIALCVCVHGGPPMRARCVFLRCG
jgi:hypothetical protein